MVTIIKLTFFNSVQTTCPFQLKLEIYIFWSDDSSNETDH